MNVDFWKVRTMPGKNHFEMREYNIDLVNEESNSCVFATGRPYPIYPSKKGLSPESIRDYISRFASCLYLLINYFHIVDFHLSVLSSQNCLSIEVGDFWYISVFALVCFSYSFISVWWFYFKISVWPLVHQ